MKMVGSIVLVSFVALISVYPCESYRVLIDAVAEECFYDRVEEGTKLGLTFEVIEGGFLDIDVRVTGPDGEELLTRERESSGKVAFSAGKSGTYTYCFSNKMSTVTPKEIMFSMDIGDLSKPITNFGNYSAEEKELIQPEKFQKMVSELRAAIYGVKHEQEYMEVRDRIHRRINESTNFRVVMWAFFESVMILAMAAGQVIHIKRFFEVRRVV